jgi:hypothetical protein
MTSSFFRARLIFALILCSTAVQAADLIPRYGYIAPGWLQPLSIDMGQFWGPAGFPERGTNYYSTGAPKDASTPYWERFNPVSPYYQTWFGTYVINHFQYASEWSKPNLQPSDIQNSVQRLMALSAVDGLVWNTGYGDPAPQATVIPASVRVTREPNGVFRLYYQIQVHSDVGGTIAQFPWYPPYSSISNLVTPYAPMLAEVQALLKFNQQHQNMVFVYSSNAIYQLRDGTSKFTPTWVGWDQAAMTVATRGY